MRYDGKSVVERYGARARGNFPYAGRLALLLTTAVAAVAAPVAQAAEHCVTTVTVESTTTTCTPDSPTSTSPTTSPTPPKKHHPKPPKRSNQNTTGNNGIMSYYTNQFARVQANGSLRPRRIDEGVDYSGHGDLLAVGNGVDKYSGRGPWFGGLGYSVVYQLTDGPAAGKYVYDSEGITPTVHVGQKLHKGQVIATMHANSYPYMETGFGSPNKDYPAAHSGYKECATSLGVNFSQLMQRLGAPGGVIRCGVDELLPAGYPDWNSVN